MPLWLKIILCILAAELLGGLGGFVTASSIGDWYAGLVKPPGTPPNWIFGPVWTALYAMIGSSLALVWHRPAAGPAKRGALTWFAIQFALNLAWTPVFFGAHRLFVALVVISALLVAIAVTIRKFRPISPLASRLLVPYAVWVSYATWLNAGYWWLNR